MEYLKIRGVPPRGSQGQVRKVREDEAMKAARITPVQAMEWLQENGISQEQADTMREEIRLERDAKKYWWE